jgi:DNA polymerase phi
MSSKKRKREARTDPGEGTILSEKPTGDLSKKRKREIDVELVKVYNDLADEQENVRLAAAHTLLSKIYKPGITSDEQTKTILTRLFRGLCSSRKSARLGFSIALTELLSQLASTEHALQNFSVSAIIEIFKTQSAPENGTSGQEERDHYFGRVFGAEAILKSDLLFREGGESHFNHLLDLLCSLALKKPWLRPEFGWVLYNCITDEHNKLPTKLAVDIVENLIANKLIRTPEGVAIWIAVTRRFPKAKLPTSAWKSGDPLARKDISALSDILKDARAHQGPQSSELSAQGSARWSPNLHFAWDVVLAAVFRNAPAKIENGMNGKNPPLEGKKITFDVFWNTVVDESLFAESSSAERRAWGFGLWRKVFETAPPEVLLYTFTPQATRRLADALKGSERLLRRSAERVTQSIQIRLTDLAPWPEAGTIAASYIQALLQSVSYGDFDQITKSKTLQGLIDVLSPRVLCHVKLTLGKFVTEISRQEDGKTTLSLQKSVVAIQWKMISARLRHWEQAQWSSSEDIEKDDWTLVTEIFESWLREVCISPNAKNLRQMPDFQLILQPQARHFAKERLELGFEQALKFGSLGFRILNSVLSHIHQLEELGVDMTASFADDVQAIVQTAWQKLSTTAQQSTKTSAISRTSQAQMPSLSFSEALSLLYCLLLFQIYSGETEAVQLLQEVVEYHGQWETAKPKGRSANDKGEPADAIMEILLSFASRPSKLLRRITIQIFEAFAANVTGDGLEALCRVLETKENLLGQQQMFQAEDVDMVGGEASETDSSVDELESDIEVESSPASDDSDKDTDSEEETDGEEEDEELAKFDAALASALGTRSLNQHDVAAPSDTSDTSSDEDMDDDQMLELDMKLAEVFRARNEQDPKNKKKDAKDAKENIVNFKNRVLDLIESYFRHQQQNPLTIDLLVPLLKLARTTQTKQLADRSRNIVQQFCSRCKGPNAPELRTGSQTQHATDVLRSLHEDAGLESSNAHANMASLSSILIVKALVKADQANIRTVIDVYASTRMSQLTNKKCRVQPGFFTDWNNWCQTAREKLAT